MKVNVIESIKGFFTEETELRMPYWMAAAGSYFAGAGIACWFYILLVKIIKLFGYDLDMKFVKRT